MCEFSLPGSVIILDFLELNYVLLFQWSPSVGSLRTGGFSCNSHVMDQNRARNAC